MIITNFVVVLGEDAKKVPKSSIRPFVIIWAKNG